MSSRWQASKIGLINFWYYDEQEFPFVKGRMLLRGSNGSGKSVTMQSVVPLLLDGNMSPERLDPFGSRDRKMSSYLLEEDDGREERTGYLYLEFKRKETENYLTIGMGIRARRGKPLDKWYFSLTDGRRVGADFFLYKETNEKVTLSKKELENRIAAGGQVFDRQADYMEYVNRQIFGFDTVEEYKEMIDLLIQLRTPKLSKDFKPSVINDILSDSLQPLSDDDLRPMSDAIENMDQMTMNLKSRREAQQAAQKIQNVYDKYNRLALYEKAKKYQEICDDIEEVDKEQKKRQTDIAGSEEEITSLSGQLEEMQAKHDAMEKERESLSKSDAVGLKDREAELAQEMKRQQSIIDSKNATLEAKQEQYREEEEKQREEENRKFEKEKELGELLEEMQTEAESMAFEEHSFFQTECEEHLEETIAFDTHEKQFSDVKNKIYHAFQILQETNLLEPQAEELLKQRDRIKKELDAIQRDMSAKDMLLVQEQNAWKEALYAWNRSNTELILDSEQLKDCSRYAQDFKETSDFAEVRKTVTDIWFSYKNPLELQMQEEEKEYEQKRLEKEQTEAELTEWENAKDPQPERSEAVRKNRQRLDALKIPYQEFYKAIEFGDSLTEQECNHLEEALLSMGILDALVVDASYREQVLTMEEGCEDRYLFVQKSYSGKSLLDVLELNDSMNDIFSNQRLTGILSGIAYNEESMISVSSEGIYQMGVLSGTITGEHVAGFLGARARERNRQEQIRVCKEKIQGLQSSMNQLEAKKAGIVIRMQKLEQEYQALPQDTGIRTAFKMLVQEQHKYETKTAECKEIEERWKKLSEQIQEKKKKAIEIAQQLYLQCTYAIFQEAKDAAAEYEKNLIALKSAHEMFLQSVRHMKDLTRRLESIDADLDEIRYDLSGAQRHFVKLEQEHASIVEQLKLTDYEQIRERLDACITWLKEYPEHLNQCLQKRAGIKEHLDTLRKQEEAGESQKQILEQKRIWRGKCYEAEFALAYVRFPEEMQTDVNSICEYLEADTKSLGKQNVITSLNQIYFENRGFLNEYQVMQGELFKELDENRPLGEAEAVRQDFTARYQGIKLPFSRLLAHLEEDIAQLQDLIKAGDRELFEDILANTVSRKIRGKINASNAWVEKMNALMGSMNTSSGLKLSLRWRSKTAESENQLDTKELVELLKKDYRLMSEEEAARLSTHFRSKVEEARRRASDSGGMISFYQVMKETLDYRKWFEFQLFSQKKGERVKELTNSVFGTFSGGEKAMSMYVPLFSAVVAKYQGGRADAPRLVSLDEAFAGVDNRNIRDMFRLMTEFSFDFIINSQVLWGDCDTLDALAIYQLIRPENAKFVTVMPYVWTGHSRELMESEEAVEQRRAEIEQTAGE